MPDLVLDAVLNNDDDEALTATAAAGFIISVRESHVIRRAGKESKNEGENWKFYYLSLIATQDAGPSLALCSFQVCSHLHDRSLPSKH
ncbi:hypothetical protein ACTXT7_007613 [Hymenolepis weldensis]